MKKKKTALIISLTVIAAALSSCGTSTPAATSAPETTSSAEQTTAADVSEDTQASTEVPDTEVPAQTSGAEEDHSERTEINESEWADNLAKIHDKNAREEIFKNHTSLDVVVDTTYAPWEYTAGYYFYGKEYTYYCAGAYEEMSMSDVRYELLDIGSQWEPKATYYIDLIEGGYQYWYMPANQDEWLDPQHEHITAMYMEDGMLHMDTLCDEEGTRTFYENVIKVLDYEGGSLVCETLIDPTNFEMMRSDFYIEKDGNKELLKSEIYSYDLLTPQRVYSICGFFEREAAEYMTVTITGDPGTEKEITKSITIPKNCAVDFFIPSMAEPVYYTDKECTQPFEGSWDMNSDITLFVVDRAE